MKTPSERFANIHPGAFFLSAEQPGALDAYLRRHEQLLPDEQICRVGPAGDGNMNCTLRVRLDQRSLIVKQARPWVEKYPHIDAPWDRVLSEARFYMLTSPCEQISGKMPKLLDLDAEARVLILEDVGEAGDYSSVYRGRRLSPTEIRALAAWLADLHRLHYPPPSRRSLVNREMRLLNHTHIFELPLQQDNGLQLDSMTDGLRAAATRLAQSKDYVERVSALGDAYLADGSTLIHGDFFPGSWLSTENGPTIIDPEFAFFGRPEFDVGVCFAHLHLSKQPADICAALLEEYQPQDGFDWALAFGFAGCEVMRRLIGVAQLPLELDLSSKQALLDQSVDWILRPVECIPGDLRAG